MLSNTIDTEYNRIEKQLEDAYRRHAPQSQIDHLETELAKYVNEGDLKIISSVHTSEIIAYHGTSSVFLPLIKKQGLKFPDETVEQYTKKLLC